MSSYCIQEGLSLPYIIQKREVPHMGTGLKMKAADFLASTVAQTAGSIIINIVFSNYS